MSQYIGGPSPSRESQVSKMATKTIVGGMPDTMEYYTMFHLSLKYAGPEVMLADMLLLIVQMMYFLAEYDRVMKMLDSVNVRRAN